MVKSAVLEVLRYYIKQNLICKHSTLRFESEPLKAALATDSCIGAMISPSTPGSGYVLLHHVMGELDGIRGAWGYPEGGMGAVSAAIAKSAISVGAQLFTDSAVKEVKFLEIF